MRRRRGAQPARLRGCGAMSVGERRGPHWAPVSASFLADRRDKSVENFWLSISACFRGGPSALSLTAAMAELVTQPAAGGASEATAQKADIVPSLRATPPAVVGPPAATGSISNRLGSKVLSSLGSVSNRLMGSGSAKPPLNDVIEEIVAKPADSESLAMPQIALPEEEAAGASEPRISKAAPPPRTRPSSSNLHAADRRSQAGRSSRRLSAVGEDGLPLLPGAPLLRERDPGNDPSLAAPASAAAASALPAPLIKCLPCLANLS